MTKEELLGRLADVEWTDFEVKEARGVMSYQCFASGQKSGQKSVELELSNRGKLLKILKDNPKVIRAELSVELSIAPSAVQRHINALKSEKRIERIGGAKGGYWKIR